MPFTVVIATVVAGDNSFRLCDYAKRCVKEVLTGELFSAIQTNLPHKFKKLC